MHMAVAEREEQEKKAKIFEEMTAENLPNLMKNNPHTQEAQRNSKYNKLREPHLRHVIIKLLNARISKAAREETHHI